MVVASLVSVPVATFFLFLAFTFSGYFLGSHVDVGPNRPTNTTSTSDFRRHDDIATVVLATDVLAAVFLLIYLIEDAPWHKTQMREHAYLSVILAMIFSAPCVTWYDPTHGTIRRNYDQLQHLMMASLVVRISSHMTAPERIPGFFEYRGQSAFFEKQRPTGTLKAMRTVTQLDELIGQVLNLQKGFSSKISDSAFNVILLGLFMLVELTTLLPGLLLKRADFIIYAWWAVIWMTMLHDMFKRWFRVLPRQKEIDNLLRSVLQARDTSLLRYTIWELNMPTLIEVGTPTTTELISDKALESGGLGVVEKAIVVNALQKRGIRLWKEHQQTVADFMLSCRGLDLTLLKNLIDTGGDYYNLYKLVYEDITERKPRQAIQLHLREQGLAVRSAAAPRQGTRGGIGVKILSDVDDTLYSSGGHFPAGCDKNFPKHRVYPGCLELFKALDWSYNDSTPSCSLVFLSARPHVYKSLMEDHSYQGFRSLLKDKRLHTLPTLLPGSLARGICATVTFACRKTKAWRRVGEFKYTTFKKYAQLYLEYDYIFCGDNGQGDLLAGQHMVAESVDLSESDSDSADERVDPNPRVLAVLIHDVMPDAQVLALEPPKPARRDEAWREQLRGQRIFFHRTYLGAAAQLFKACPGLLTAQDLRSIADEAVEHFEADVRYCEWKGDWSYVEGAMQEDHAHVARLIQPASLTLRELEGLVSLSQRSTSRSSFCREASDSSEEGSEDAKLLV